MVIETAEATIDRSGAAVAALATGSMAFMLVLPRTTPGVLAALTVLAFLVAGERPRLPDLRNLPHAFVATGALALWALISTLWAVDRGEAASKGALLLLLAAAVTLAGAALRRARPEILRTAAARMLVVFAAALVYLAIEEASGHVLKRLVFGALPFTRPAARHVVESGDMLTVARYITNRNMAAAMLALWPMLLIARALYRGRAALAISFALGLLALGTFAMSQHETSVLALAASVVVFAVAWLWPRVALGLLAAGWLTATLLVVPLAGWGFHKGELHRAAWLPHSARHRIVLWAYAADQVGARPLTGIGASSTKELDARRGPKVAVVAGTPFEWRSGTHSHNVYLQTWYELGLIGALLLGAAGLATIAAIARLPRPVVPYAAATLATAAAMGASTWGMWQPWFLGAFAVSALLVMLSARVDEQDLSPDQAPSS